MPSTTPISALRYAVQTDTPVAQTAFQNLATDLDNKIIPVYATTAARDTAIPSPTQGMHCYVSATAAGGRTLMYYTGSAWVPNFRAPVFAVKASDTSRSTVTMTADPTLVLSLEASTYYTIEMCLMLGGDDTADLKYRFTYAASALLAGGHIGLAPATALGTATAGDADFVANGGLQATPYNTISAGIADTNFVVVWWKGVYLGSVNAGSLTLEWGSVAAVGAGTILKAGSYILATRVV